MATTYTGARRCADADSHLMEEPGWLAGYADASTRERLTDFSAEMNAAIEAGEGGGRRGRSWS